MNKLINGDCLEVLPTLGIKADLILSDMPFGLTKAPWDNMVDLVELWKCYHQISNATTPILLHAQCPFDKILGASNLKELRYDWIWEKTQATGHLNAKKMPMKSHEQILVFYQKLPKYFPQKTIGHNPINSYTKYVKTQNNTELYGEVKKQISGGGETDRYPRSILRFASDKQHDYWHSTQKPLALIEYMIKTYTEEGDLVVDSFAGSCTTAVACSKLNRNWICIEKDTEIFEIAKRRLNGLQISYNTN